MWQLLYSMKKGSEKTGTNYKSRKSDATAGNVLKLNLGNSSVVKMYNRVMGRNKSVHVCLFIYIYLC